jgi:hypothetical protein
MEARQAEPLTAARISSISRASHEATLFTDDMTKLGPQVGAGVSKTSALGINQASSVAPAIVIGR